MRISDWSSDVCSSDLQGGARSARLQGATGRQHAADQPLMARAPRDRAQSQIALPLDWNAGGANDGPLIVGTSNADAVRYLRHVSRSEEHTSELQSLMRISYAVLCLKKKTQHLTIPQQHQTNLLSHIHPHL